MVKGGVPVKKDDLKIGDHVQARHQTGRIVKLDDEGCLVNIDPSWLPKGAVSTVFVRFKEIKPGIVWFGGGAKL